MTPPIKGMWVVASDHELTAEIVHRAKEVLERAAETGEQVVVVEGIEFWWRPTPIDQQVNAAEALAFTEQIASMIVSARYPESDDFKRGAKQMHDHIHSYLTSLISQEEAA